ncbi:serine/threonine protein kinase, partial [Streptomyces sp. NPDC060194]
PGPSGTAADAAYGPATGSGYGPARQGGRRRWPAVVGALVAAALVGGGVAASSRYVLDDGKGGGSGRGGSSPSASASASGEQRPSPSPSGGEDTGGGTAGGQSPSPADGVPNGWVRVEDPEGFSLLLPQGWERRTENGQIDYTPDGGVRFVRIAIDPETDWESPYEHQTDLERGVSKRPGYQRLGLVANTYRDLTGARWEFTWTAGDKDASRGPRHAISQSWIDRDGTEYVVYMSSPEERWAETREQFDSVLRGFRP